MWIGLGLALLILFSMFNRAPEDSSEISFSEFIGAVKAGDVRSVEIEGELARGRFRDGSRFRSFVIDYPNLFDLLDSNGVETSARPKEETAWYVSMIVSALPLLIILGLWIFFMRQLQSGGSQALSFGKSKARLVTDAQAKVTFRDVAGVEEAKEDLQEVVEFLREPAKFRKLGGKIPKGVLLVGPPGTGKTLLARAVAGEADAPFFSISGSDFVEMFVGVGASRVRDLFEQAKRRSPCIVFVDEIDAVGRHRGAGLGGGHDEREQTLNQLLVEMDGFEENSTTIVIAATNRPDVLDPALLRPGRFDRQVVVARPDIIGRAAILKVHVRKIPLDEDVDLQTLARGTPGFTGADLANLCNEAALLAAREDAKLVSMRHFERAKDKVVMGAERRSMIISEEEKRSVAVHEAGHALVALSLDGTDPIHKVSIIPRGRALGVTMQLPVDEKHTRLKSYLISRLAIMMGGRAAEEIVLDQFTTGAANDIEQSTNMARMMVCEWGMSPDLGPISLGQKDEQIFLGREIQQHRDYSESTAVKIDGEIKRFLDEAYGTAIEILNKHRAILDGLTEKLIDLETLEGREIALFAREKLLASGEPIPNNASFSVLEDDARSTDRSLEGGRDSDGARADDAERSRADADGDDESPDIDRGVAQPLPLAP